MIGLVKELTDSPAFKARCFRLVDRLMSILESRAGKPLSAFERASFFIGVAVGQAAPLSANDLDRLHDLIDEMYDHPPTTFMPQ